MSAELLETVTRHCEVILAGVIAGSAAKGPELDDDDFHNQLDKLETDFAAAGVPRATVREALLEATQRVSTRISGDAA